MITIVGFTGKAQSGKGTASEIVIRFCEESGYAGQIVTMAEGIKSLARQMGWNGQKDEKGRRLLQLIGTEIGRECFYDDYWVDQWTKKVMNFVHKNCRESDVVIVCDDVRFDNEARRINALGGRVIKLEGRGGLLGENASHASEQGVSPDLIDTVVNNSGSMEELTKKVLGEVFSIKL